MFSICWIKISVPHTLQSFTFFLVRMSNTSSCRIESCSKYLSKSCWWRMLEQCFKLDSMRYLSGGNCVWQSLEHYLFELNWNVQVRTNHSDFLLMYGFAQAKCATRLSNYFLSLNFQQFAFLFVGFNQSLCNSAHICLIGAEKYANLKSQNCFAQFAYDLKEYTKIFAKVSCMMQNGAHRWIGIHYVCTDDYAIMFSK